MRNVFLFLFFFLSFFSFNFFVFFGTYERFFLSAVSQCVTVSVNSLQCLSVQESINPISNLYSDFDAIRSFVYFSAAIPPRFVSRTLNCSKNLGRTQLRKVSKCLLEFFLWGVTARCTWDTLVLFPLVPPVLIPVLASAIFSRLGDATYRQIHRAVMSWLPLRSWRGCCFREVKMLACFPLRGQTGLPTCIMTNFPAKKKKKKEKKTFLFYCFSFCVCVVASRNHSSA